MDAWGLSIDLISAARNKEWSKVRRMFSDIVTEADNNWPSRAEDSARHLSTIAKLKFLSTLDDERLEKQLISIGGGEL